MSASPVYEFAVEPAPQVQRAPAASVATRVHAPAVPVVRTPTREKTRSISLADLAANAMMFIIVAGFACFVASLLGNVMVEKARREGIHAAERARFAARESAALRERVQAVTGARAVEDWAKSNGFVVASLTPDAS